jgi:hypothetical protein
MPLYNTIILYSAKEATNVHRGSGVLTATFLSCDGHAVNEDYISGLSLVRINQL